MTPSTRMLLLAIGVSVGPVPVDARLAAGFAAEKSGIHGSRVFAAKRPADRGAGWKRSPRAEQIRDTVQRNSGPGNPGGFDDIPVIPLPGTLPLMLGGLGLAAAILHRRRRG